MWNAAVMTYLKALSHGFVTVLLSHTPSTSSAMKTPENAEEDPDDPEPEDEGDIQIEYSSD